MRSTTIGAAALLLAGCFEVTEEREPGGQPGDSRLVGTWTNSWSGDYGGYIRRRITLYADGSYANESMSYFSSEGGDVDTREEDSGTWSVRGDVVSYRSSRTGRSASFRFRHEGGALWVDGQMWTRE